MQGEVSNYKLHPSGHQYFTLKDQRAQIACVIFRNAMAPLRVPLTDGAQVQVYGNVSVFEARGQYQLSVQIVQTRGAGLLQAKFEALKRKLEAEGLFEAARKRALPKFPARIGIITSPSGAAVRDILNVLRRRAPGVHILISPVRVQGMGAAAEIATAIRELSAPNESWPPLDLIVLARGGGSIEDLWEFNEEIVARAIFHCAIPIVSAIGHEVDFTIADFVADLRAPTPSAAAELVVPDFSEIGRRVEELAACLQQKFAQLPHASRNASALLVRARRSRARLVKRIRDAQQQIDFTREKRDAAHANECRDGRAQLTNFANVIKSRNPQREVVCICAIVLRICDDRFGALAPVSLEKARHRLQRPADEIFARSDRKRRYAAVTASSDAHGACCAHNSTR